MFSISGYNAEIWYYVWVLVAFGFSFRLAKLYGVAAGLAAFWALFSGLRIFAVPTSPYAHELEIWNASLSLAAASAFAAVLLSVASVRFFSKRVWTYLWSLVAVLNAVLILAQSNHDGLLGNASMSGCLNACLFPLFFDRNGKAPPISLFLIPLSVLFSGQSQPIALLFISIGVVFLVQKRIAAVALAITASFPIGFIFAGHELFDPSGRTEVWRMALDFFRAHANPFIGTGLGTFYFIGPFLTLPRFHMAFLWMHSDWGQIFFEQGIIGFALVAVLFVVALEKSRRDIRLLTSLVVFGCFGIANFPLHNPISALLGAFLIHSALARDPEETSTRRQSCQE